MNPGATVGPHLVGHLGWVLWIYFRRGRGAGEAISAAVYRRGKGTFIARIHHHYKLYRCIFNCRFLNWLEREAEPKPVPAAR